MLEGLGTLIVIGILSGLMAGFFGVGGGVLIVSALTIFLGFTQQKAIGTSLASMLPPVGLLAVIEYYKAGFVDVKASLVMAFFMLLTTYLGARLAVNFNEHLLRIYFGAFLIVLGSYIMISHWSKIF